VEVEPGHVLAFCRRGGGYGDEGRVAGEGGVERRRRDVEPGEDSEFPNPNSAVELIKLRDGKLMLIYNDSFSDRTPLTAALSADGGKTWTAKRISASGRDSFAYPSAVQTPDGRIHLVYTTNARKTVTYSVFTESDVTGGK
jgi:predicted neuraminidase